MPIYMDRHDIPADITPAHVAQMHQQDLKIQHLFGCKGITYWCDPNRNQAFCLIDAPDMASLKAMHEQAHGAVPHKIIEVDPRLVESFLGRIEDPEPKKNEDLLIIDDSAFRIIMSIETSNYLHRLEASQYTLFTQKFHHGVSNRLQEFKGRVVRQDNHKYLISFLSVSNAILCALKIRSGFKYLTPKFDPEIRKLNIGIHGGVPVEEEKALFGEVIATARNMCEYMKAPLVISSEIKALYEAENRNARIDRQVFRILNPAEERFLNRLVAYCEKKYNDEALNVPMFSKALGYSKSKLYRQLKNLTGMSPNQFLRDFRLRKGMELLHRNFGSIAEIAYETGFNNPAYFSKCFSESFGILPSKYLQQHHA